MLVVGVGGAAGFAVGRITGDDTVTTTTMTTVTTQTTLRPASVPPAVERTRRALVAAAESKDWAAFRRIPGYRTMRYTFGEGKPGGAVAFWQRLERQGGRPLETLAAILRLPYVLDHGIYWWPFAFTVPPKELTPYEIRLLSSYATTDDVDKWKQFGGYFGYRTAIEPSGRWQIFVSGD